MPNPSPKNKTKQSKKKTCSKQDEVKERRIMSLSSASRLQSLIRVRKDYFNYFGSNRVLLFVNLYLIY